jgi:hypothetical protein
MNFIKALWIKIPEWWRLEIKSAVHTFVSAFILTVGIELWSHHAEPVTVNIVVAVVAAALRSGWKAGAGALWAWIDTQIIVWKNS